MTEWNYQKAVEAGYDGERVIVAAAVKVGDLVIPGARHFSPDMQKLIDALFGPREDRDPEMAKQIRQDLARNQGFMDQFGTYMDRKEALEVAKANGQYGRYREPQNQDILYSEDLW